MSNEKEIRENFKDIVKSNYFDILVIDEFCGGGYSIPTLTLLVDGLNEVNGKNERKYINEIKAQNL